jgi:NhaP-type Na+/H+ or K+/H+ antiporter
MPALNSDASSTRRAQFVAFALFYSVPALAQGLHFQGPDAAFLGLYALCAAHMQVMSPADASANMSMSAAPRTLMTRAALEVVVLMYVTGTTLRPSKSTLSAR